MTRGTPIDDQILSKLVTKNHDMRGRRVINAGDAQDLQDYVTLNDLNKAIAGVTTTSTPQNGSNKITIKLLAAAPNVTFTALLPNFNNIRIMYDAIYSAAGATDVYLQFNSDAGSNYSYARSYNTSATGDETFGVNTPKVGLANSYLNFGACNDIVIPNYANTTRYKTGFARWTAQLAVNSMLIVQVGFSWANTNSIGQILLGTLANNFAAGSLFTLIYE